MFKNIFSFEGRIRRTEYGLTYIGYIIIANISDVLEIFYNIKTSIVIKLIILIPMLWILLAQGAKRCHDRGNSGWYQIIPFYVFWMIFADSDHGPNEYGENPKGIGNHDDIEDIGKPIEF
ncbi:DUF805 domain-containing protein [Cognatitamlana onchidii]|uniref:DUF805 domain-containing protein n=1 Tax=Cognatitamlana onchidii TaxID=2562860 RepID=UPI0010A63F04|nr:DUF805 domain-containing protein [Algibacter onchidii]